MRRCAPAGAAQVVCNGEEVLTISGTQAEYNVDVWSGNHPFYQGATTTMVVDEGRVNRFKRRFAGLEKLAAVATVSGSEKAPTKAEMLEAVSVFGEGGGKGGGEGGVGQLQCTSAVPRPLHCT